MHRIRDIENDLMKNVEGWETGTLFGEPVYHTVKEDQWVEPDVDEFWTHSSPKHIGERDRFRYWL